MKKSYLLLFALAVLLSACSKDPEACFSSTVAVNTVTFSNCSLEAVSYDWEFGDGTTSIAQNPIHTYAAYGTFQVTLRVTSKRGRTATITQAVTLAAPPPGNTNFTGNYSLNETCTSGPDAYTISLTPVSNSTVNVTVGNLYRANPVVAVVSASGTSFTIARQPIFTGYDVECTNGTANASGTTLNLTYTIYPTGTNNVADACTATLTR